MTVPARNDVSEAAVAVGVDTHLDEHVSAALDRLGRRLGVLSVPTTGAGYAKLLRWAQALGVLERVVIEGPGSFGAGLARLLRARGGEVLEVGRPKRCDQHRSGKPDPTDAELAARAVLAGTAIGEAKGTEGRVEMIRVLGAASPRRSWSAGRRACVPEIYPKTSLRPPSSRCAPSPAGTGPFRRRSASSTGS